MSLQKDCYGHRVPVGLYERIPLKPCEVVEADGYTYMRFTTDAVGPIHRIDTTESGTTKIMWAYGAWADRATLEYTHTLNEPIEIQEA